MNAPAEAAAAYCAAGKRKTALSVPRTLLLGVLAGIVIAIGAVAAGTAAHAVDNAGLARLISGALFAFGLPIIMLTGTELFTGNNLLCIPALGRQVSWPRVLRNWGLVYLANLAGGVLVAAGCAFSGQFGIGGGQVAVYFIRLAAAKCALPFGGAVVQGVFCNLLVCLGVLCALAAKSAPGRMMGAYIPVLLFVVCGFEHCVANMFYIPAGLFARAVPEYAALAVAAGVNTAALNAGSFVLANLLPVTLGNLLGGAGLAGLVWGCFLKDKAGDAP